MDVCGCIRQSDLQIYIYIFKKIEKIEPEILTSNNTNKRLCNPPVCVFPPADSEMLPVDCLRPRSFAAAHRAAVRRSGADDPRLSISLCDLSLQQQQQQEPHPEEEDEDEEEEEERLQSSSTSCHVPQNSQNSQLLPGHLDAELHFHPVHGVHVTALDKHTVARLEHRADERTLVFSSRPLRCSETLLLKVKSSGARPGSLSYGVTSCDPGVLRPSDLPSNPESLVDRKEFWAVCRVAAALHSGDILGFAVNAEGEVVMSHNGVNAGMQLCVDNSRPLWMFYGLHDSITQLRILGQLHLLVFFLQSKKEGNERELEREFFVFMFLGGLAKEINRLFPPRCRGYLTAT